MNEQISMEAGMLITLVRHLYKQTKLSQSCVVDEETIENAIKVCDRLEPLINERRQSNSVRLSEDE